jgi:hypothetical protein
MSLYFRVEGVYPSICYIVLECNRPSICLQFNINSLDVSGNFTFYKIKSVYVMSYFDCCFYRKTVSQIFKYYIWDYSTKSFCEVLIFKYIEICALLGYYAASCTNCLPTFRDNVWVPSSRVKSPSRKERKPATYNVDSYGKCVLRGMYVQNAQFAKRRRHF